MTVPGELIKPKREGKKGQCPVISDRYMQSLLWLYHHPTCFQDKAGATERERERERDHADTCTLMLTNLSSVPRSLKYIFLHNLNFQ